MSVVVEEKLLQKTAKTTKELIAELYRINGKAEIFNGEIVKFMSTGDEPGIASDNILVSLKIYQRQNPFGKAYGDNKGFLVNLPNRKSFSPDACFFVGERSGMRFLNGAPVFAVEIRSENDYGKKAEREIANKRQDYFAAGTEIVWDVDLQSDEVIKSFHRHAPDEAKIFRRGEIADAEPVLPGWTITVDELFE